MLYYCSPYYRSDRFSGANKRFEEVINQTEAIGVKFKVVVVDGNKPPMVDSAQCVFIPRFLVRYRLFLWLWLNILFLFLKRGVVISDFKPIIILSYLKHDTYLLIHDLRRILDSDGALKGFVALVNVLMLKMFPSVITVSEASKSLLVQNCGLPSNKVIVSYNGLSEEYEEDFEEVDRDVDILYVAHFEDRKRHIDLLDAIELCDRSLKVCFVGLDNGCYSLIENKIYGLMRMGHDFSILSGLSEEDLISLYRRAKVYAFPSELEGFGMPLIEAKSQGCRVLCSDIDVFKEILSDYGFVFKVRDVNSLFMMLMAALSLDAKCRADVDERFLWVNIVAKLLKDIKVVKN